MDLRLKYVSVREPGAVAGVEAALDERLSVHIAHAHQLRLLLQGQKKVALNVNQQLQDLVLDLMPVL